MKRCSKSQFLLKHIEQNFNKKNKTCVIKDPHGDVGKGSSLECFGKLIKKRVLVDSCFREKAE